MKIEGQGVFPAYWERPVTCQIFRALDQLLVLAGGG